MDKTPLRVAVVGAVTAVLLGTVGLSLKSTSGKRSSVDAQSPDPPRTRIVTIPFEPLPSTSTIPPSVVTSHPAVPALIAQHQERCASQVVADIQVPVTFEAALSWTDAVVVGTFSGQKNSAQNTNVKQAFPTLDSRLMISQVLWTKGRITTPMDLTFRSAGQIDSDGNLVCVSPIPIPIPGVTYVVFVSEFAGGWSSALAMDGLYPVDASGTILSFDPGNDVTSHVASKSFVELSSAMARRAVKTDALAQDRANLTGGLPTTAPTLSTQALPDALG